MPGFDGTGPAGLGPMTGRCMGFCVLRLPAPAKPRLSGFAGLTGWPVGTRQRRKEAELAWLQKYAEDLECLLTGTRERIATLEADELENSTERTGER